MYTRDGYLQILEEKKHIRIDSETSGRFIFGASKKNVALSDILIFIRSKLIAQILILIKPSFVNTKQLLAV